MERDYNPTSTDNRFHPRAKALMILIAVVTLIAIWLVPDEKKELPQALPEMASPPQVEEPAVVPLPVPPASQDEDSTGKRAGDTARAILAKLRADNSEPDAGEVFAQAEQLQTEGLLDDAYLLYRLAARQGDAQAALVLGTQADPAFYTSETSVLPGPDLQQSYKWYRAAAAAGNDVAVARLQQLRERVEQSAVAGDVAAQRLMLQWQ